MTSDAPPRRSRAMLWLIIVVAAAPAILSYLAYYVWRPSDTVNYGDLIEPRQLPTPTLVQSDGIPYDLARLRGKWLLVSLDAGHCDAACARKLLYMRQLRLTQGREMDRVERVWLVTDDVVPSRELLEQYPGMHVLRAARTDLPALFAAPRDARDHLYVVDPLGNIMLRYPADPQPRRMIKDLTRLLKASQVG